MSLLTYVFSICCRSNRWKKRGICVAPMRHMIGNGVPDEEQVRIYRL